jgi:hypothetical protein
MCQNGVHTTLVFKISHLLQTCGKFCLRVTLSFHSKLSKPVCFREKDRPPQICAQIKVLRKSTKISCPKIFHKNASFVLHIGDIFCLFLLKPSANVDICNFARKFIAFNFAKISIIFSQEILEKCGNGFSYKTNITIDHPFLKTE